MLDRTIPFYNTIMKCEHYTHRDVILPEGYTVVHYHPGFEWDWARMECAIGDFDTIEEAETYFTETYLNKGREDDIFFALHRGGKVVGSCMAWTDQKSEIPVNSLHWLVVDEIHQRKGIGRALCMSTMNRFMEKNGEPVYIHTQPWSYHAILLYLSLGFRLQKTDSFSKYVNQYDDAMETLSRVLNEKTMERLREFSDD